MQIETKFNVGDKHWFIDGTGNIILIIITGLEINVRQNINSALGPNVVIEYRIRPTVGSDYSFTGIKEDRIYNTKQEAGEAWLKSQGLKCGVRDD